MEEGGERERKTVLVIDHWKRARGKREHIEDIERGNRKGREGRNMRERCERETEIVQFTQYLDSYPGSISYSVTLWVLEVHSKNSHLILKLNGLFLSKPCIDQNKV